MTDEWRWSGPNPIVRCAIAVDFARPIAAEAIAAIGALHSQFKARLPRRTEQQSLVFQFGVGAGSPPIRPQLGGISFDRLFADGEQEKSLTVNAQQIIYQTSVYTRWEEVWQEARELIQIIAPVVLTSAPISGFIVEYHDRFLWSGVPETARPRDLLGRSDLLVPHALDCRDLWHSHHGFFKEIGGVSGGRRLDNVNINVIDRTDIEDLPNVRALETVINHRIFLREHLDSEDVMFGFRGKEPTMMDISINNMHDDNKIMFRSLLTPEIIARIPGLEES